MKCNGLILHRALRLAVDTSIATVLAYSVFASSTSEGDYALVWATTALLGGLGARSCGGTPSAWLGGILSSLVLVGVLERLALNVRPWKGVHAFPFVVYMLVATSAGAAIGCYYRHIRVSLDDKGDRNRT
jgi:hypothetical protein